MILGIRIWKSYVCTDHEGDCKSEILRGDAEGKMAPEKCPEMQ